MGIQDRIEQMEPRERQLLNIAVAVFFAFLVFGVPLGCSALLSGKRQENEDIRAVIAEISASRAKLSQQAELDEKAARRFGKRAPALAGYLEQLAKAEDIKIPESQDRPDVPLGKRFSERSTKVNMREVPMYNLVKLLEKIERSGYPMAITRLNIRKVGNKHDSYDVEMIVSTYDQKTERDKKSGAKGKTVKAAPEGDSDEPSGGSK